MQEIKCPKCGEVFQVDESGYNQIVKQVRDKEFTKEITRREKEMEQRRAQELELLRAQNQQALAKDISKKDAEISGRDQEIAALKAKLEAADAQAKQELELLRAQNEQARAGDAAKKDAEISGRDQEIAALKAKLEAADAQAKQELELLRAQSEQARAGEAAKKDAEIAGKDQEIAALKEKLSGAETAKKLAVTEALGEKDKELSKQAEEIIGLKGKLESKESEAQLNEKSLREQYETQLRAKDEQIEYYKDFKAKQSTKMIGESLEQHCLTQFNSIRMTAFPTAYFEKDNDARSGSKGDFIYRETSEDGEEFISIMFEMKNEADATATKHKNEHFFKELDKDRREKNCEYAILVSLLEGDSDLYNNGIVDVSYKYPKMYVIRPQFFIPMITLLRNAAQNSLQYRRELQVVRNQQLDIVNFEENMEEFKKGFARNYRLASEKFATAIEEIDKSIVHLQKIKDALVSSENNLRLANNKADDLSIKKLTKNAPSVRAKFDELKDRRA